MLRQGFGGGAADEGVCAREGGAGSLVVPGSPLCGFANRSHEMDLNFARSGALEEGDGKFFGDSRGTVEYPDSMRCARGGVSECSLVGGNVLGVPGEKLPGEGGGALGKCVD
jgi:hypothetical protein